MQFIPEKKLDKFDNVAEIVNEIYRVGREIDCINLYVDMQGEAGHQDMSATQYYLF